MKRVLVVVGLVVGILVVGLGVTLAIALSGGRPIEDGRELPGGAVQIKDGFTSSFLLDAGAGIAVLVDAGEDPEAKAIKAALAKKKFTPESVLAILLTHGHGDHVGGVLQFPQAETMAFASDVALAEGRATAGPLGRLRGPRPTGVKVKHVLVDGEALTIGRLAVTAFAVPGHTAGSGAYLVDGVLYLGDSADAGTDGRLHRARRLFSEDVARNEASLRELAAKLRPVGPGLKALAFSHSGPLEGFAPLEAFAAAR